MTKEQFISKLEKQKEHKATWVIEQVEKLDIPSANFKPLSGQVGDIFIHGPFRHPCLVISKVKGEDNYWAVCMTSDEDMALTKLKSRWNNDSYISAAVSKVSAEEIAKTYKATVSRKEVLRIKNLLRKEISKI